MQFGAPSAAHQRLAGALVNLRGVCIPDAAKQRPQHLAANQN